MKRGWIFKSTRKVPRAEGLTSLLGFYREKKRLKTSDTKYLR